MGTILAFSFRAQPGKGPEMERLLNDPEMGRNVAKRMGATRNVLFFQGDRMVRFFEIPDGVKPRSVWDLSREDPALKEFLRKLGRLAEPAFDIDNRESYDAFMAQAAMKPVFDVGP